VTKLPFVYPYVSQHSVKNLAEEWENKRV